MGRSRGLAMLFSVLACSETEQSVGRVGVDGGIETAVDVVSGGAFDIAPLDESAISMDVASVFEVATTPDVVLMTDVTEPRDASTEAGADVRLVDVVMPTDVARVNCPQAPVCDIAAPSLGATVAWRNLGTRLTVALGSARHRGRDLLLREGDPQWAIAKFAYGLNDDDLNDEEVEIWLLRDCTRWERLGTALTSRDAAPRAPVEGVDDQGGRVYFEIPSAQRLAVGWHRMMFVVRGDHSIATQWIEVVPTDARVVVSDVDGTLTESENAAFISLLTGPPPAANPGGADMLRTLVGRGYHLMYITARPEWLESATHSWLTLRGFPRGIVHTTLGLTGAVGKAAADFKIRELGALRARFGRAPDYGFGNTDSDVSAYNTTGVTTPFYYRFTGDVRGGTRIDDYTTLLSRFAALPTLCR
jgi:hypothetical protein